MSKIQPVSPTVPSPLGPAVPMVPIAPPADTPFTVPAWPEWIAQAGLSGPVRALGEVLAGAATSRSALSSRLQVRSTTVSAWVGALVRAGLLFELPRQAGSRGRPLGQLVANPDRLTVAVMMVRSQALHLVTVNLLGQVRRHESAVLPPDGGNEAMARALRDLQRGAVESLPAGATLAGFSYALSGLVDVAAAKWLFVSRWPKIRHLGLREVLPGPGTAVHVVRNMDAQLQARRLRRGAAGRGERTLMLHWGYGIGATFSAGGSARIDHTAGFGEVGHWQATDRPLTCRCGHTGCLETVAALWAIGPALLGGDFDHAMDETAAADLLRGTALVGHPTFDLALREMVLVLGNLSRVFFPTHLVVSGPFIENQAVWTALTDAFNRRGLLVDLPLPRLEAQDAGHRLEQEGAAMPLLLEGVARLLALDDAASAAANQSTVGRAGGAVKG